MIYFDTCYIVKSYLVEHGTPEVRELIADHDEITSSIHGRAEFVTALHRHLREGRITQFEPSTFSIEYQSDLMPLALVPKFDQRSKTQCVVENTSLLESPTTSVRLPSSFEIARADAARSRVPTTERIFPIELTNDRPPSPTIRCVPL